MIDIVFLCGIFYNSVTMERMNRNERIMSDIESGFIPISKDEFKLAKDSLSKAIERRKKLTEDFNRAMSESSETYHDNAPAESALLDLKVAEAEINSLQEKINSAVIYEDESAISKDIITLGGRVTILYDGEEYPEEVEISSGIISDPSRNTVSLKSPLGKALLGHKSGDFVEFSVDNNKIGVRIVEIK
jgi:transcription elongation factor GreA